MRFLSFSSSFASSCRALSNAAFLSDSFFASAALATEMVAISFCLRSISESLLDKELAEVFFVIDL